MRMAISSTSPVLPETCLEMERRITWISSIAFGALAAPAWSISQRELLRSGTAWRMMTRGQFSPPSLSPMKMRQSLRLPQPPDCSQPFELRSGPQIKFSQTKCAPLFLLLFLGVSFSCRQSAPPPILTRNSQSAFLVVAQLCLPIPQIRLHQSIETGPEPRLPLRNRWKCCITKNITFSGKIIL